MASTSSGGSARTRVGRYELGRTLGEGTFAKVKFARNIETGENVAIKILDKDKVLKHKMIGQICNEDDRKMKFEAIQAICKEDN
ncbi:unnamed protein product [Ilex paraguariensis]|uniref:Protein kinase domain-containing protein n=1 Tax=Ilex paraguariensis TaxID=185542 RepID=A0ABC8RSB2_9AQUA